MPTRSSRQLVMLSGLVALIAVVIGIVFFATSHPLRGAAVERQQARLIKERF